MKQKIKVVYKVWGYPSEIICCTKGIFVFVKDGEQEIMQQKVEELLK